MEAKNEIREADRKSGHIRMKKKTTQKNAMKKLIEVAALLCTILTVGSFALYICFRNGLYETLAITFGTTLYHILMRVAVAFCVNKVMHNRADLSRRWYQPKSWEAPLYAKLKVKKWKDKMPTYQPDFFDPKKISWEEIAMAMCQAEVGHELIVVCSFLPIVAARWFHALPAFLITSLLAAAFDLSFVIMQRYNRARIMKLVQKKAMAKNKENYCN